ncbi:hypothetical protein G6O67_002454 [Ophiocordyceps sinensis]|uniref:Uncharacterized protein n=1 Tax=Ophiocordyceps sinensis TaxID=72228 RepID=A0A8H4PU93_9HYPO|nr:hypothetical protein G6O67_002454 [Ophiocordyceps sinensis]
MGGNLAAWTSSLACSGVRSKGTRIYVYSALARRGSAWHARFMRGRETHPVGSGVQGTWPSPSAQPQNAAARSGLRLTIHDCTSGTLTSGETPRAAMAGTASCMAPSAAEGAIAVVSEHGHQRDTSGSRMHHDGAVDEAVVAQCLPARTVNVAVLAVDQHPVDARAREQPRDVGPGQHLPHAH